MHQPRTSTPGARAAWLVAGATAALLAAACRDLVTDDVIDAEARLCDRLDACDIPGCSRVRSFFAGGDPIAVDLVLDVYGELECDRGCADAPLCLDQPGICARPGQPCEIDAFCCGGTAGEARCAGPPAEGASEGGTCCRSLGVPCDRDQDCCGLGDGRRVLCELPADAPESGLRTCGGVPACGQLGRSCREDGECCSGRCLDGLCDRLRCVPSEAACVEGVDTCCSVSERCIEGTCKTPSTCLDDPQGTACSCGELRDICTPGVAGSCCGDLVCVPTAEGRAVCASASCLPVGSDCASDDACRCEGQEPDAVCLEIASSGVGVERTCQVLACTLSEGGPCDDDQPCCASAGLVCDETSGRPGRCVPDCEPSSCERDPFSYGPPITPTERLTPTEESNPACVDHAACASAVCDADPYCCCFLWDEFCVESAETLAEEGIACMRSN